MKKIVVCGGHFTPALALIEQLEGHKSSPNKEEIIFFGRKFATEGSKSFSAEYQTTLKKNIKFYSITAARLQRKYSRYTIPSLAKLPCGFLQSLILLIVIRPNLIVSFGGYLSLPVVFCGWLLGIDSITHEQAIIPGLATRINSLFVKKIFLSWPQTQKYFNNAKSEVIGNLIRGSLFKTEVNNPRIRKFLEKSGKNKLIFVTGGNQGSHFLNKLIFESQDLFKNYAILHQIGTANFAGDHQSAKAIKNKNYLSDEYIEPDNIGPIMKNALLVIARSGANTVWELAILAKPAILVPLPIAAQGEQVENAKILKNAGSAIVINQSDLTTKTLKDTLEKMFTNLEKFQKPAKNFQKTLPKDASRKLSNYIAGYLTEAGN
ncbi:hypothetical protein A2697_01350 [Candidatus Curtissbacteria bacterium RIFCSPHIGHO2_01_FULL_41_44]|uniref:UDP-N-acetylglucosamine--N-acetylmuramyl-(pentapeptide) pyrophosphoryl-undecaprenol N-acetylglucosamine transferase n=1 Tax=Candidatus Curtissbacteria bacterium RIFCSPLOWO2_01_FULL_42_50 TaxID=1797730 RepID=A0A1F5H3B6_9BACT|nr:MAG: hypothetical protein A3C33_00565 [Candidatus Curtissbacteria bacterium RIFCSPHIGHO2_02_FULL_42_58]OGD94555.1 MAG: hypothetical protein A2697_01350 [Candidatus Curtissbacteria bacterium RIFCSPHIGHO2_01_FULL_41_44]OGD97939.1 MAG: hypothetical protein A3E71_03825 [Candidatus Curtissbacteria bacterium RIFCSPHIGHO2_12_FULL_42_33]OGD98588.1 MAG: hypothetical protein A3B54_05395 [Candidatus Curtissbacteria bacterium RIFCSPLOWO2_01_FULL_42_50]OGE02164.1 MAG: hypothetical protein A3G16_02250 [Ca